MSRTTPVASEMMTAIRTMGNPGPMPLVFAWGKACWFLGVSTIEAVVPSTNATRRPFQSQSSLAPASIFSAVARTRRTHSRLHHVGVEDLVKRKSVGVEG